MQAPPQHPGIRPLAVLAGALLFVASLPGPGWPLVFLALVPWVLAQERVRLAGGGDREAARVGALFAGSFWGLNLSWVLLLVPRIGQTWPLAGWAGQVLLLSLLGAGAGVLYHRLRRAGRALPLAALLAFMSVEWARGHLLGPLRFPWSPLALPLAGAPVLLQPGAWIGQWGLGAGVVLVNGLLAMVVEAARSRQGPGKGLRPLVPAALALGLLAAWLGVGWARLADARTEPVVQAGVVQPAIPLVERRGHAAALEQALETATAGLEALLEQGRAHGLPGAPGEGKAGRKAAAGAGVASGTPTEELPLPRVIVLPETHLPRTATGPEALEPGIREAFGEWSRRLAAEILVGGYGRTAGGSTNALYRIAAPPPGWGTGEEIRLRGEARGVETEGGRETEGPERDDPVLERYDKSGLVPGVEWGGPDGLVRGGPPTPLAAPGAPGPLICIESAWTGHGVRHARAGARWLVNVTNDAWLAEAPLWTRTPAFRQHPAHLQLRSVETGLGAIRVGNNGLSGVVDPLGRWTTLLPPHRPGAAWATVHRLAPSRGAADGRRAVGAGGVGAGGVAAPPAMTVYARWGHPVPGAVSLVTLFLVAFGGRTGTRRGVAGRGREGIAREGGPGR